MPFLPMIFCCKNKGKGVYLNENDNHFMFDYQGVNGNGTNRII